jgi:hypothetical protein
MVQFRANMLLTGNFFCLCFGTGEALSFSVAFSETLSVCFLVCLIDDLRSGQIFFSIFFS